MQTRLPIGWWWPTGPIPTPASDPYSDLRAPACEILRDFQQSSVSGGAFQIGGNQPLGDCYPLLAHSPPLPPEQLGSSEFRRDHGLRYAYMTGAMANGIGSCAIVEAMARAGMLGSFGAAGLSLEKVTLAIDRIQSHLGELPFAINLIHSPNEPAHEMALAELLLKKRVRRVEASAYLDLTPAIVRYRASGLGEKPDGSIEIRNRVIAKVSRSEVATRFLSPAPARLLNELLQSNAITPEQARCAAKVPMCDDLTAEADSGGHTDNRAAMALLPALLALRDRLQPSVRVGLGGGLGTPQSLAGAFALGADYVVTGSINQACVESGSSEAVRKMLAEAGPADVTMAPAADMFEMGVKVQVLKRGTMFAMRGQKLFELYRAYSSWEAIPAPERVPIEKQYFRRSFEEVWAETQTFFARRDPTQLARATNDLKHRMALVFRWYLGLSSRWANAGEADRQLDYQVWCGPAMGAFNEWAKGSFLEAPGERKVALIAANLLYGAALHLRGQQLKQQGIDLPANRFSSAPRRIEELNGFIA